MNEAVPVRAVEQRITRPDGEVVETRVVEFATQAPAPGELALPSAEMPAACTCGLCQSPLRLTGSAPARRALPPAPARPWWRWRR